MAVIASQVHQLAHQQMNKPIQTLKPLSLTNVEKILESSYYIKLLKEKRNSRSMRISQPQGKIINQKMRNRVVKWLKEISQETFQFNNSTLYRAIQILDEYLLISDQHYSQLQLIAAASLFMSSKLEQRTIIAAQCYVECSDDLFTKQELEQKELLIYETLGFNLCFPQPIKMIRAFIKVSNLSAEFLKEGEEFLVENLIANHNVGHHYLDIASAVMLAMMERLVNHEVFSQKLNYIVLL